MTIFVEVTSDRLEVTFSELPGQCYCTDLSALIFDTANQPYRRAERDQFFHYTRRPTLAELKGRPC